MSKIVRKLASVFVAHEDRDSRGNRKRLFAGAVEMERANLENIGRAWRKR